HQRDLPSFPTRTLFRSDLGVGKGVRQGHVLPLAAAVDAFAAIDIAVAAGGRVAAGHIVQTVGPVVLIAGEADEGLVVLDDGLRTDRKSTRLNSSHVKIS